MQVGLLCQKRTVGVSKDRENSTGASSVWSHPGSVRPGAVSWAFASTWRWEERSLHRTGCFHLCPGARAMRQVAAAVPCCSETAAGPQSRRCPAPEVSRSTSTVPVPVPTKWHFVLPALPGSRDGRGRLLTGSASLPGSIALRHLDRNTAERSSPERSRPVFRPVLGSHSTERGGTAPLIGRTNLFAFPSF